MGRMNTLPLEFEYQGFEAEARIKLMISLEINRKGQNFGFGRKNDPKKLQKGFRLFRQKDRKNRKSQFRQKEGYFGRKTQFRPKLDVTAALNMDHFRQK